jgi:hypothetical protein
VSVPDDVVSISARPLRQCCGSVQAVSYLSSKHTIVLLMLLMLVLLEILRLPVVTPLLALEMLLLLLLLVVKVRARVA